MKAMIINEFGENAKLQMSEVAKPTPGEGDVLAEVHAASINPLDFKIRNGMRSSGYNLPLIMGNDFAGVVVETSSKASKFKKGDKVYGRPNPERIGTFAEYIAVDEGDIALMPKGLDYKQAAAVPLVGLTSYQVLHDVLKIQSGQKILIHAGSGGIGSFAIQLAKVMGAFVATTTSTKNIDWVKGLGADVVVDYKKQKFEEELKEYDAVFDTLGGQNLIESFKVLKRGGKIASLIGLPGDDGQKKLDVLHASYGVQYEYYYMKPSGAQLAVITGYIEQGKVKPVVGKVFSFEEAQQAMDYSQTGHAAGKIILKIK